ncbi:MAG: hypothetical protein JKY03_00060 [Aureispira sp.]|nr:hypothetical protein [Aureispira sp.]
MGKVTSSEETENPQLQSVNQVSQNEQEQSGNSSSNFVDNSPEALEAKKLQEMADNSAETIELQQLQENATAHDSALLNQQNPKKRKKEQEQEKKKKKKPNPKKTSLKDYVDKKPEHDPGKLSDKELQATREYTRWKKEFVSKKESLYSETELLLACRLAIRELREKGAAPKSIVKLGEQYLKQAKKQATVVDNAVDFEGELNWERQVGKLTNTDFGKWILEDGPEPNETTSILNCWELVLYSAFKAGAIQKDRIVTLYKKFGTDLSKGVTAAFKNFDVLKKGSEYIYDRDDDDTPIPIKGDMVIFKDFKGHVTIATGNTNTEGEIEIMSLWTQNSKNTYKTTIDELLTKGAASPVKFFTPNW